MTEDPKSRAVHWMLRMAAGDMDEAEWEVFTLWLEETPDHAALLDEVQASHDALGGIATEFASSSAARAAGPLDDEKERDNPVAGYENEPESAALPEAANDNGWKKIWPFAGLVAAAIAVFALWPSGPDFTTYATEPGETRVVAVTDEITMTLNGGSEVTLIEDETRVRITRGEIAFAIDSVEPSALKVEVAGLELADYGTIFNVTLGRDSVTVAVAEGAVGIDPKSRNIEVGAGERVTQNLGDGSLLRSEVDPETVGAWQEGRLEFDNTPAPEAVAMLERSIGSRVKLDEALEGETLTGSMIVSENERETVSQFAAFLGARARRRRLAGVGMVWDVR